MLPTAWLAAFESFYALGFIFSALGLYWTRNKPADWVPPAWYRAGYFGQMRRDRFRVNCMVGIIAFPSLAIFTYAIVTYALSSSAGRAEINAEQTR
jgi:hypothetical protein